MQFARTSVAPLSGEPVRQGCPGSRRIPCFVIGARIARPRAAEMAAPTTRYGVRCDSGHPVSLPPLSGEAMKGQAAAIERFTSPQGELNVYRAASSFRGARVTNLCSKVQKDRMQWDIPFYVR